jgi:DNA-binding MarR family transcriptional regulator
LHFHSVTLEPACHTMTISDEFDGPEILGEFVPYLAHRIGTLMDSNIDPHLKEARLSIEMWRVLFVLAHVGDHNLVALSGATGVKTSTLSRLVGRMEQRELISRVRSERDNRTVEVSILDAGQRIVDRLTPYALKIRDMAEQNFSDEELPVLKSYLRRLYMTLQEYDRETSA